MKLVISSNRVAVGNKLRNYIESRLQQSFQRLDRWVQKVSVCLDDINGPRGGVCKQCRLVVTLNGAETVVVTETGSSVGASVSKAIRRAGFAMTKRVKSRQDRRVKKISHRHLPGIELATSPELSELDDAQWEKSP
ncbi:HPF/RaiA family ribosome-associated protein [Novipirellula rosea]|uniref:Sigma 54 modulation protein / S30EA ribosomal protein n=1 Tax=Novipirellula rosea TaxID=1031540 RepID=A0ABP8NC71_9BACT|tara:strand:+ start:6818 stop:7225 length:408 start_codon:yes stop_codon:yes gene_type:complete